MNSQFKFKPDKIKYLSNVDTLDSSHKKIIDVINKKRDDVHKKVEILNELRKELESLDNGKKPSKLTTVFAGFDGDAVNQARQHFAPYPPSSPAIALFKNGELVHFVERHNIEGRTAGMIAEHLKMVYDEFC